MENNLEKNIQYAFASPELAMRQPLLSLNHISFVCRSVAKSVNFYVNVLGFVLIKRPSSFDFKGAWLHGHGIGIHLLECDALPARKAIINPKDNHISFQCPDIMVLQQRLESMNVEYVTAIVEDGGISVDQIFFHDPDGNMIEICNCQNFPVIPLSTCSTELPGQKHNTTLASVTGNRCAERQCTTAASTLTEELLVDMMKICI